MITAPTEKQSNHFAFIIKDLGLALPSNIEDGASSFHSFIEAIMAHNAINSAQLSRAIARLCCLPLFDLRQINMQLAPATNIELDVCRKHLLFPFYKDSSHLYVALIDPTNHLPLLELSDTLKLEIVIVIADMEAILDALEAFSNRLQSSINLSVCEDVVALPFSNNLISNHNQDAIIEYVDRLVSQAVYSGASDIHIEPFENFLRVRFRIDGVLKTVATQDVKTGCRITARLKILADLDIAERRIPQDGRIRMQLSGLATQDIRINTLPALHGEKIALRLLHCNDVPLTLEKIGLFKNQRQLLKSKLAKPQGMILITGPTGSGKTVTLYSALHRLNSETINISTVEDPIEIQLSGVTQVCIKEKTGLDFATVLRAFLRQDPDIIMLGEIRDIETAEIAIKAAQTGHLILTTLHTIDAPAAITRLSNMGIAAYHIASALSLIIAQRLVRKLCAKCKVQSEFPTQLNSVLSHSSNRIKDTTIFKANPHGCPDCLGGYKGRTGIFQIMPISKKTKHIILAGGDEEQLREQICHEGVEDLKMIGLNLVLKGITSIEEVHRVI